MFERLVVLMRGHRGSVHLFMRSGEGVFSFRYLTNQLSLGRL